MKRVCKKCFPKGTAYAVAHGTPIGQLICCCKLFKKFDKAITRILADAMMPTQPSIKRVGI